MGGITGVTFGTEQINLTVHNTLRSPGHFHATVVSGTALAFMGLTYYVVPLIFRKRVAFWGMAKVQPYVFALGMLIFSMAMTFAGTFGVPRRHWDISFAQAPFDLQFSPTVDLMIGIMAIGGLLAVTGGAMYIVITVSSVFFGRPVGDVAAMAADPTGIPQGVLKLPPQTHTVPVQENVTADRGPAHHAPGTLVLVGVFLVAFIVYYFLNWQLLAGAWKIG